MNSYVSDISITALRDKKRIVTGMTDNSQCVGTPASSGYGIFAFIPALHDGLSAFSITFFALINGNLQLESLYVRTTWGGIGDGVWRQITLV